MDVMAKRIIKVKDLVNTNLHKVKANDSLWDALLMMKQNSIRHLPVVDGKGLLVGILADRDILNAIGSIPGTGILKKEALEKYMTAKVVTCAMTDSLAVAAAKMRNHRIDALPVTDEAGKLLGIITSYDFLTVIEEMFN